MKYERCKKGLGRGMKGLTRKDIGLSKGIMGEGEGEGDVLS
jgi:hypothetical protein